MSERLQFIRACVGRRTPIRSLCEQFGISERTGHKWLKRFAEAGEAGLEDRSHAPHRVHYHIPEDVIALILKRRKKGYGARKIRDWLLQKHPERYCPAASSIGELLKREGCIPPRRRRPPREGRTELDTGLISADAPNDVWTADFKGEFRLGTGRWCYPLTVMDLRSRFLLGCNGQCTTAVAPTRRAFVRLFREYGLPRVLRTDNGMPFAHPNALGRLGALGFWWVRLGIRPEHIAPGKPAENGAHERFHKTLKAAVVRPPSSSLRAQQRRFDGFRAEYNTERPHEAVPDHLPPGRFYAASPRPYTDRLPALTYPSASTVRLVSCSGYIKWQNQVLFLSSSLAGQYVSLTERDDDLFEITYASLALGEYDPILNRFIPRIRWLG